MGGKGEWWLGQGSGRTGCQSGKSDGNLAGRGNRDMDIVALQDRAGKVGCVSRTFGSAQALNCRFLVSEGFKELKWKFRRLNRAFRPFGYSFFIFNGCTDFTILLFALQGCAAQDRTSVGWGRNW